MGGAESFYDVIRRQGVTRRSFSKFCSLTAASLGFGIAESAQMAHALETQPRTPVIWMHGLECTCCSESFIRSAHPLVKDVVLSMISLDYDDTIMAAAGHQADAILKETRETYKGKYVLAVEGNPPLNEDGMYCIDGGRPFVEKLKEMAEDAFAVIAWGACASWGCVQAAKPNPTQAVPIDKVITNKPIIKVPGCPPIAEVMTGVVTYITDEGARKGYCLYKMGCKGPTTYNACSTVRWNNGVSYPIQSGHGCIGCSEDQFWDQGSFYDRLTNVDAFGVEANADKIGATAAGGLLAAITAHAAVTAYRRTYIIRNKDTDNE